MGHDYNEKRLALMDLMPIMLGELTEPQKTFIDRAITEAYNRKGINENPRTWGRVPPVLGDILNVLKAMEHKAARIEEPTLRSLVNRLSIYVDGVFSFLNKQTRINFDNRFVCFDIGELPKQVKPVLMFLVLDYVYMNMRQDLERKFLVIDEAWSLLSRAEDASYVFEIVKTSRKFNLALFLINQEVEGMTYSEAGKSVLANSAYTILLKQKPAVIQGIQDVFHLSNTERTFLLTAAVGEGILLMEDEHSEIKIIASEEEHKIITTKPDEILKEPPKIKRLRSININVDPDRNYFRTETIKSRDLEYLLGKGYSERKFFTVKGIQESYVIKPRQNEGQEHCFLTYHLAEYLESKGYKVSLYQSVKPDIVFETKGIKYAVEIETGTLSRKNVREKVKTLNKEYGENWFFVVVRKRLVTEYRKYGAPVFRRCDFREGKVERWIREHNHRCKEVDKDGKKSVVRDGI